MPYRLVVLLLTCALGTLVALPIATDDGARETRMAVDVRAVMRDNVSPSADVIFQAVSVRQTAAGEVEEAPASEDAWLAVEQHAAQLAESAAGLVLPRTVVPTSRLLHLDRERWNTYAQTLRDTAERARLAAQSRNASRLLSVGGDVSLACEQCHLAFRTPGGRRFLPAASD